ncbi:Prenylcysteine lyase-domain-containing protein [Zychaea mexicana]|uniref:Prenylcysteine lyase-domain-containing protein n=1 Tax=Zychaea mexicana TaxID=64656 RepID=UPI0022FF3A70|nr:Prenylcysteine lyase-domain-containing protein [Zychaea mexicana]KAI9484518.1 Prenylcysteine lyase-domain-containing protein [Zychaea mexicana]
MRWLTSAIVVAFIATLISYNSITITTTAAAQVQQTVLQAPAPEKRVAIIGGGAAGTSAAYWINNAFPKGISDSVKVSATIYERNSYLGGRSTVVPIKDDPALGLIEVGASIYIERNYNLMNATERFGLERTRLVDGEDDDGRIRSKKGLGIWDGEQFLFEESGNDYWDSIKILWRYGYSPVKFKNHLKAIIERFSEGVYHDDDSIPAFRDVGEALALFGIDALVNETAADYLEKRHGISEKFVREIIQTASRANYGQDVEALHAFGALVSMAASGSWATKGGNFQIFEEFAKRSGAAIELETAVMEVQNITVFDEHTGEPVQRYVVITEDGMDIYDTVLMTAPLHSVGIELPYSTVLPAHRQYHTVHVTMVAGVPDPSYFGRTQETMPTMVVSTGSPLTDHFSGGEQPFTTFAIHKYLDDTGESVVKMFSSKAMSEDALDRLFVSRSWTLRKEWEAFPDLVPITEDGWPTMILDGFNKEEDNGILYINAFESCISTMETETVASKNAVRFLREQWCGDAYCVPFGDGWGDD